MPVIVVAGAGDLGGRLAGLRAGLGDEVVAVRRREAVAPPGVRPLRADLATGAGLARLPPRADAVVFCAAPDRRDEAAYRTLFVDGLRRLLDACAALRVLLVSSTAVYGGRAGEWVDEDTPAQPPAFNGRLLLEAECTLAGHAGGVVLRLSGLYGPGRSAMLRKARSGQAGAPRWTNRIHVDDAAAALSRLLDLRDPRPLYLGSDDEPVREHDLLAWLRAQEGLPAIPPETAGARADAVAVVQDPGRRIRNARLREAGWVPAYPDFRAGYRPLLARAGD